MLILKQKMKNVLNNIFIISGPSGAGEDSIIKGLETFLLIEIVITTTTREMRQGESQKKPYCFISKEEFLKGIKENKFFEYAKEYNNNYYGVTNNEIKRVAKSKKIVIWKIEYKGVISAKKKFKDITAILINAPLEILEKRIKKRHSVTDEYIKSRMIYTKEWLKYKNIYDYEVINEEGKLDKAINKVLKIIKDKIDKN